MLSIKDVMFLPSCSILRLPKDQGLKRPRNRWDIEAPVWLITCHLVADINLALPTTMQHDSPNLNKKQPMVLVRWMYEECRCFVSFPEQEQLWMAGSALHLYKQAVGKKEKAKTFWKVWGRATCLPFLWSNEQWLEEPVACWNWHAPTFSTPCCGHAAVGRVANCQPAACACFWWSWR